MEKITKLEIKDRVINAKGSFLFTRKADEVYGGHDKDGNPIDGVSTIHNDLVTGNELGIIKFWNCALANVPSANITEGEIIEAVQNIADEHGLEPLFKGALDVFTMGFYKEKMKKQKFMMQLAVKNEKDEKKREELEGQIQMLEAIEVDAIS